MNNLDSKKLSDDLLDNVTGGAGTIILDSRTNLGETNNPNQQQGKDNAGQVKNKPPGIINNGTFIA